MYTELKSYQIIIALLKEYGIRKCVLSAGARNVPFVHSVEEDPFFECYSVVDERSAGYFALGLAQQSGEPVVISCTSSTAACNYWPPVAEAYYQNVPLVVLTSDRDPALLGQREDQMIDQVGMYDRHVRKSVNLPIVKDDDDFRLCQRLVNEALLELDHHEGGPVHINVPMKWYSTSFTTSKLPPVTKISRIGLEDDHANWEKKIDKLRECKRVLVVCGQKSAPSEELEKQLEIFFERYSCAIAVEHMSNINVKGSINTFVCMEGKYITPKKFDELCPELVISFGGNIMQGLKPQLRTTKKEFEHWLISPDGLVCDVFGHLNTIFECSPEYFFRRMNDAAGDSIKGDSTYYEILGEYTSSVQRTEFPWSNVYAVEKVSRGVPANSIVHLSINTAIRTMNFFELPESVRVYANIGTYGIDGCLSSFLGQASVIDELAFLVIGDLAFFYDMNALRIKHVKSNVRILLLNNHGGEEFYYNGMWQNEKSDLHTSARHNAEAEGWAKSCGYRYLRAEDKKSFDEALLAFLGDSDRPVLFEVFTEMSSDCQAILDFYDKSRPHDAVSDVKRAGKDFVKRTIGKETAVKIADKLGVKLR